MAYLLIVLFVLTGAFLWEQRTWFPAYREEQTHRQLDRDFEAAVMQGNIQHVRRLLAQGADLHMNQSSGTPVVFMAAEQAWPDLMTLFLSRGFDVNTTEKDGETLLSTAASGANISMVRFLIRHGANVPMQGANALAAAHASMEFAEEEARAPLPPRTDIGIEANPPPTEDVRAAKARRPYEAVIAMLRRAGARE